MTVSTASFTGYINNGTNGVSGTNLTVTNLSVGTILLGMAISDVTGAIVNNTRILSQISGTTGGVGTYTVSISQNSGTSSAPLTITGTTAGKILVSDYNSLQSKLALVMGTGSSNYGYGQTTPQFTSSQLSGTAITIRSAEWINLRNDIINAYYHQGSIGSLPSPAIPATGSPITGNDYVNYSNLVQSIYNNVNATPPSGQASLSTFPSGVRTTSWNSTIYHTVTLTFPSANAARYYFNSGSNFQFSASLVNYPGYPGYAQGADTSYAKDNDWNMLLTNMGTITFNLNSTRTTGSYTTIGTLIGYYQLTTSPQNIFQKQTSSPTYTNNQYDILASIDATGSIITFSLQFADLSAPGGYGIDENVEGTLTSTVQAYYATGSNVQVSLPSYTATMTGGTIASPPPPPPSFAGYNTATITTGYGTYIIDLHGSRGVYSYPPGLPTGNNPASPGNETITIRVIYNQLPAGYTFQLYVRGGASTDTTNNASSAADTELILSTFIPTGSVYEIDTNTYLANVGGTQAYGPVFVIQTYP
jgi:hypothetical protein